MFSIMTRLVMTITGILFLIFAGLTRIGVLHQH
jgi:putative Ca2+/H+ antiporter (TMEM165/GDT1 family)